LIFTAAETFSCMKRAPSGALTPSRVGPPGVPGVEHLPERLVRVVDVEAAEGNRPLSLAQVEVETVLRAPG
jgi:hypothetical protein